VNYNDDYFDRKWLEVIPQMPNGGSYHFNLRQFGHDIVKDNIKDNSKVFDFACGLGVVDKQLNKEKGCNVYGCDYSKVAVDYCNDNIDGTFKQGSEIFGDKYDYILALHYLEHIKDPVKFINTCLRKGKKLICILPNNFSHHGEHIDMQWDNWDSFYELFKGFKIKRLDKAYPESLPRAFKHPIISFEKKKVYKKSRPCGEL
jgi:SAM-dependent methyltransferase